MSILRFATTSYQTSASLGFALSKVKQNINLDFNSPPQCFSTKTSNHQNENWTVVYHLPLIKWASAFNRLKVYQGGVSVAGIPITFVLETSDLIPSGSGVTFATIGLTGLITLALSSLIVQNLIGFIYVNLNNNKLKFAYVDYWGHRKDIITEIDDLIPDGAQEKPTRLNFYQKIGFQSNENLRLILLQRYGKIKNSDVFNSLFY